MQRWYLQGSIDGCTHSAIFRSFVISCFGQIYVIPALVTGLRSPAGMQVQWRGNGVFAGGTGRPGDRVQVWNGVVRTPWMAEVFDLTLHIDPAELRLTRGSALSFESYFEIETLP